jgi:hypothetical protein
VKGRGVGFWGNFYLFSVFTEVDICTFFACSLRLTILLYYMAKDSEIVLLQDSYGLNSITTPESREKLVQTLSKLDQRSFTELELRHYFEGLKLAMGAFIQKVTILESNICSLRREQVAAETRMEAMYLKAQLEIQELRAEISDIKLSKGRINQIVKVAKALQGNAYAPYAVKSLVDGVMKTPQQNSKVAKLDTTKLPSDFTTRLEFAQRNGFKWNQNNRIPSKAFKQLEILEEWENQFCAVEKMTLEQVVDKSYVVSVGPGAIAGALMFLERELGALLPERKTFSIFNCYQKAIKMWQERQVAKSLAPACNFDIKSLVSAGFCHLPIGDTQDIENRLKMKALGTVEQVVSGIKKSVSRSILPVFITWRGEDGSDTERLYSIQSGVYDDQLIAFITRYRASYQD